VSPSCIQRTSLWLQPPPHMAEQADQGPTWAGAVGGTARHGQTQASWRLIIHDKMVIRLLLHMTMHIQQSHLLHMTKSTELVF